MWITFRAALLSWIGASAVAVAVLLAANVRGSWFSNAAPIAVAPLQIKVGRGGGTMIEDAQAGARLEPALVVTTFDSTGTAIVIPAITPFSAATYSVVEWDLDGGEGLELTMLWHNESGPNEVHLTPLLRFSGPARVSMSGDPNWQGGIRDMALAVRGQGVSRLRIEGMRIVTGGIPDLTRWALRGWFGFKRWRQSSINFWYTVHPRPWPRWPVAVFASVVLGALVFAAWCRIRKRRFGGAALAGLLLAGWIVADVPWLATAFRQVDDTWWRYRRRDDSRLTPLDADMKRLLDMLVPKLGDGRVFVFSDVEYVRGRAAYDLLPRRVYGNTREGRTPPASVFRPGDQLAFIARNATFDPAYGRLALDDGSILDVDVLLIDPGASLFRVRGK